MVTLTRALLCAVSFVWSASAWKYCGDVTCDSDQTCSPYDGKCYDRLIYYADFSVYYASTYTGTSWTDDGTNVSALFDNDNSTTFTLSSGTQRVLNITFTADYYIHAVELLAQTDSLLYGYIWNDGFAQLSDNIYWNAFMDKGSDDLENDYKRWMLKHENVSTSSALDDNDTLPFRSEYLYFLFYSTSSMELQGLNIYGIGETDAPTNEPTTVPTSFVLYCLCLRTLPYSLRICESTNKIVGIYHVEYIQIQLPALPPALPPSQRTTLLTTPPSMGSTTHSIHCVHDMYTIPLSISLSISLSMCCIHKLITDYHFESGSPLRTCALHSTISLNHVAVTSTTQ